MTDAIRTIWPDLTPEEAREIEGLDTAFVKDLAAEILHAKRRGIPGQLVLTWNHDSRGHFNTAQIDTRKKREGMR